MSGLSGDLQVRMESVASACQDWIRENPERCMALYVTHGVAQNGHVLMQQGFGLMRPLPDPEASAPAPADTIFLIASLTKPLTVAAVCLLVDRGQVHLDDPVVDYIPAFSGGERTAALVRHLLTHTSGLPDMLPENVALRRAHAPLSAFVEKTCLTPLLYTPGTDCRYQSMGMLLAGTIVERVSGTPLPDFLQKEFFLPLGMKDTWLGLGLLPRRRIARVILPPEEARESWTWNSPYWRELGAPWGGLHTTASEYARLLQLMLGHGAYEGRRLLSAGIVQAMLTDQIAAMPGIARSVQRRQAWGLGWRFNQPLGVEKMPECGSTSVFGHGGATGTAAWADPDSSLVCVLMTNDPQAAPFRTHIANLVARCSG